MQYITTKPALQSKHRKIRKLTKYHAGRLAHKRLRAKNWKMTYRNQNPRFPTKPPIEPKRK